VNVACALAIIRSPRPGSWSEWCADPDKPLAR
jgi:3-mercaptopyruvate sulfurtransferase SseA